MQIPLQITFHGIDHSDAVEERIREKVAKLEQFFDRITSCRVAVERTHKNSSNLHQKGEDFQVRIDMVVPGSELVVKRASAPPNGATSDLWPCTFTQWVLTMPARAHCSPQWPMRPM